MKELSLNILDIVQNSISAGAKLIQINVEENSDDNKLNITITDNGKGMSEDFIKNVADPFSTTRSTRKVGMGLSLLKLVCNQTNGKFGIESKLGVGTVVKAEFQLDHIDRPPLGNMGQTLSLVTSCNEDIDFIYTRKINDSQFIFDSKEIKNVLNGVSLKEPEVIIWITEYINENETNLLEG